MKSSEYVRDRGVIVDKNLTFQQQIRNICKSASFGNFKIGKIRKLLDRPTTAKLTHAFVSSLDYCNSIFLAFLTYFHFKEYKTLLQGLLLSREGWGGGGSE